MEKKLKGSISDISKEQLYVQCEECGEFLSLDDEEKIEVDEWGNAYCLECVEDEDYDDDDEDEDDDDDDEE